MGMKNKFKDFFFGEEEYEEEERYEEPVEREQYIDPYLTNKNQGSKQKVVNLKEISSKNKVEVVLVEPRAYAEVEGIADYLKNRRATVVNLQRIQNDQAKRIVDFLSGTVYAIGGDIQKLGPNTFLCTPDNVDVRGSITDYPID